MKRRAYAKINIGLMVLGKRPDGFHNLQTVFHQIDLFDELEFHLRDTISLTTNHPGIPTDDSNLCVKAARMLQDITGTKQGIEIRLDKNIPIGAGLGGGSADAAATLRALTELWSLDLSMAELHSLSLSLGSDVPYFLIGGSAAAGGRGELLEPLPLRLPYWIIVVTPPIHVSTAWAYSALPALPPPPSENLRDVLLTHVNEPQILRETVRNDFEQVVFQAYPRIAELKSELSAGGAALTLLSGSGSSVFAFADSEETAQRLKARIASFGSVSITPPYFSLPADQIGSTPKKEVR